MACVPSGSAPPFDAGSTGFANPPKPSLPSSNVMTTPFEDDFERVDTSTAWMTDGGPIAAADSGPWLKRPDAAVSGDAGAAFRDAAFGDATVLGDATAAALSALSQLQEAPALAGGLGPHWSQTKGVWHIESGKLCAEGAMNHGVWLNRVLPVNARIEFDAVSYSPQGDLKCEIWGDGRSFATSQSYTNATSYLAIFGGWKNTFHVLARIDEHANDRKEIKIDTRSDDPRQKPVVAGQTYRFKIERTDGKTVRWFVDNLEYLTYPDAAPLTGAGHDHFGFNNWKVKVCFDNVKVTPL
jgi:hypothetical protein